MCCNVFVYLCLPFLLSVLFLLNDSLHFCCLLTCFQDILPLLFLRVYLSYVCKCFCVCLFSFFTRCVMLFLFYACLHFCCPSTCFSMKYFPCFFCMSIFSMCSNVFVSLSSFFTQCFTLVLCLPPILLPFNMFFHGILPSLFLRVYLSYVFKCGFFLYLCLPFLLSVSLLFYVCLHFFCLLTCFSMEYFPCFFCVPIFLHLYFCLIFFYSPFRLRLFQIPTASLQTGTPPHECPVKDSKQSRSEALVILKFLGEYTVILHYHHSPVQSIHQTWSYLWVK